MPPSKLSQLGTDVRWEDFIHPVFRSQELWAKKATWVENWCISTILRMFQIGQSIPCTYNAHASWITSFWNILYPVQGGSESQKTSNQRRWNRAIFVSSNMAARKKQTILDMNCFFGKFPACPYVFWRILYHTPSYTFQLVDLCWFLSVTPAR